MTKTAEKPYHLGPPAPRVRFIHRQLIEILSGYQEIALKNVYNWLSKEISLP